MVPTRTGKPENLEKLESIFQSGKSGDFTQNTGKSEKNIVGNTGKVKEICQSEKVGTMKGGI